MFRIYYQTGTYRYDGDCSRWMSEVWDDVEYLEQETRAELLEEVAKFEIKMAEYSALSIHIDNLLITEIDHILSSKPLYALNSKEHKILRFVSPIMEYDPEFPEFQSNFSYLLVEEYKTRLRKRAQEISGILEEKQKVLQEKKQDPEYQKYLELRKKFG